MMFHILTPQPRILVDLYPLDRVRERTALI